MGRTAFTRADTTRGEDIEFGKRGFVHAAV